MQLDDGFYSSPRWSWEILDCAMPMTFDTYSNCSFQCEPADRLIMRADLTYARAGELLVGDKLMGWERGSAAPNSRRFWKESTVLANQRRVSDIIEVELESGQKFECTRDHLWFTGYIGPLEYLPARKQRSRSLLVTHLPVLERAVDSRDYMVGYLKGVWAGDGTRYPNGVWRLGMQDREPIARAAEYLILLGLGDYDVRMQNVNEQPMNILYVAASKPGAALLSSGHVDSKEYWRGWLAGIVDAEANVPTRQGTTLWIAQEHSVNPETHQDIVTALAQNGFVGKARERGVAVVGGRQEAARLQQFVQPALPRRQNALMGTEIGECFDKQRIINVRELGKGEVVSLATSTQNYVLDGAMSHNCVYCFSFFQRAVGHGAEDYLHHKVRAVNVDKVKRLFTGQLPQSQFNFYINRRMVLQWGGLSDGFDYYERRFRKSIELVRFFREIDYPISISTKGVWFTSDPEYLEAFKDAKNIHMKSSIISLNEDKVRRIERGVATSEERFKMLEWCNKIGIAATTVRFRPFVLGVSAAYPWGAEAARDIDQFVHRTKEAGCYSLTTEFMCLESRASTTAHERYNILGEVAGMPNLFDFYKVNSSSRSGLLRLNYDLKRPYIEAMQEACDKYGIKFFVSDAHHKEKSAAAGCCGLPADGPLSKYNKGQFAEAILIARRKGSVHWMDIDQEAAWLKDVAFQGAEGYNQGTTDERARRMYQSFYDFMRDCWNNPRSNMSPARYFGGALVPTAPDEHGDIVYLYNEPFVLRGERVQSVKELEDGIALRAQGTQMREDGGDFGHVAYDVVVDLTQIEPIEGAGEQHPLIKSFAKYRLPARFYVHTGSFEAWANLHPEADFVELFHVDPSLETREAIRMCEGWTGNERVWFIPLGVEFGDTSPRAYLSALEAEFTEQPLLFQRLQTNGVELLECAEHVEKATL